MKKVTAKHLMIGDWVKYKGEYVKVCQLSIMLDEYKVVIENDKCVLYCSSATPIPITEDWLMFNGWVQSPLTTQIMYGKSISKDLTMFYTMRDKSVIVSLFKENTADYERQASLIGCIYIHQLQQAYRLATGGKELKIKF